MYTIVENATDYAEILTVLQIKLDSTVFDCELPVPLRLISVKPILQFRA